jgi:hypothetical protein
MLADTHALTGLRSIRQCNSHLCLQYLLEGKEALCRNVLLAPSLITHERRVAVAYNYRITSVNLCVQKQYTKTHFVLETHTDRRGPAVNNPASYSGGPGF